MKKFLSTIFALLFAVYAFAAANIFTGATNNNWGVTTNWSLGAVPTSSDGNVATFNATSPNCVLNTGAVCNGLDMTGYAGTLSGASSLAVYGNLTFGGTITATGALQFGASGTWTSNGIAWPGTFVPTVGSVTITLSGNATINGTFTHTGAGGTQTFNNNTLNIKGSWTNTAGRVIAGTSIVNFNGTSGTSTLSNSGGISNPVVINATNTVSVLNWFQNGGSFTYTAASSITFSGIITLGATCTVDIPGVPISALTFGGTSQTFTLLSDLDVNGTLTLSSAGSPVLNGNTLKVGQNLTHSSAATWSGTTTFLIDGTGTWASTSTACVIQNNLTINTAGTLTLGTLVVYNTGTLTYIAGGIAGTGTLTLGASTTLNTSGMTWPNVTVSTNSTITLNSLLSVSGTLATGAINATFTGSAGWTAGTFSITTGDDVLKAGNTYTVTGSFTAVGTAANNGSLTSSVGGSQANFILAQGATQDVGFCSATDINSGLTGQTIWSYKPTTLSNATNWRSLPAQPGTITTAN